MPRHHRRHLWHAVLASPAAVLAACGSSPAPAATSPAAAGVVTSSPGAVVPEEVTVAGRVAVHASGATDVACRRDAGDAEDTPRLVLTMQVAGTDGTAYLLTLTVAPEDRAGSFPVSPGEDSGRYARIDVDRAGLAAASPVLSGLSGTVTVSAGGRSIGVDARLVGADGQDAGVLTGRLRCP